MRSSGLGPGLEAEQRRDEERMIVELYDHGSAVLVEPRHLQAGLLDSGPVSGVQAVVAEEIFHNAVGSIDGCRARAG